MNNKSLHVIAYSLVIVGALNWGLMGLFQFNLVSTLFGSFPMLEKYIYIFIGLSALYEVATHQQNCKVCAEMMKKSKKA
jgi:hypothetical protein